MLIALATYPGDFDRAMELADWLVEVPCEYANHAALIIASLEMDQSSTLQLAEKFKVAGFKHVVTIRAREEEPGGWPMAPNAMWRLAAGYVKDHARCPWLWLEPDCVPIRPGWLDQINAQYLSAKKAFMGTAYPIPFRHLNGTAVYPYHIHRFNPLMFNAEFFGRPFDTVRPDLTLRDAHITNLIHRSLEDPTLNIPHTFPDLSSLNKIPVECVLFHGCKDGSLIARLREMSNPGQPVEEAKPSFTEKLIDGIKEGIRDFVSTCSNFYHSGNLGDVSYALAAIKAVGGGDLVIGPEQRKTAVCAIPIDEKQFQMALPLWKAQPYLKSVTFSPKYPVEIRDLNRFRSHWINRQVCRKHGIDTLAKAHFYELGILKKFDDQVTWLTCGDAMPSGKIIVHRSPRYNAPSVGPESFPWKALVEKYHSNMLFVGLESEWDTFCRNFGHRVSYWRCSDFMELARVIKGGERFIGNQSFPLSVALGLGQQVIVEACPRSPDCRFFRDNYQDQLMGQIIV